MVPNMMTYPQALDLLRSLGPELRTGNAASGPARKFSLDHIRALLQELGDPQQQFRSVLIAGTNGKGSTAATLASIAAAADLRTGLYTSPHLLRVNERMQVALPAKNALSATASHHLLAEICDEDFGRFFGEAYTAAGKLVERGDLPHTPSFFELLTATAFLYFAAQGIELAVLEVGLGGRLDATNVVEPMVSVITDIALDHTEFLGDTLGAIAAEKAGILRQEGVLVTLSQHPEANAVIGERAVALNVRGVDASRCLPPRGFTGNREQEPRHPRQADPPRMPSFSRNELEGPTPGVPVPPALVSAAGSLRIRAESRASPLGRNCYPLSLDGEVIAIDSPLSGHHQQRNLALAVATAIELRVNHGFPISNAAVEAGVRTTVWPGRLEWLPDARVEHPPLLLDVAHNPAGAWALRAALAQLDSRQPRTLLFSCLADKQLEEMARILFPLFDSTSGDPERVGDHIILAPIDNPRAASLHDLLEVAHRLDVPVHAAFHLRGALQQARALTPEGVIVATGSVYLVGAIRQLAAADTASP